VPRIQKTEQNAQWTLTRPSERGYYEQMLNALSKIAAPLTLLLALIFLTGAASAAVIVVGKTKADLCCTHDAKESEAPSSADECADPECGCASCTALLLFPHPRASLPASDHLRPFLVLTRSIPSAPERAIDYPPEFF